MVLEKKNSGLQSRQVIPTVKHGGGNIMIWGSMTSEGVGYMCRIDGGMDADLYTEILDDYLFETIKYYGLEEKKPIFQHDNDPKHTSKKAVKWLKDHQVEVIDWPPQSPDLNPIEHLWVELKRKLSAYEKMPTSILELWERVESEWNKIRKEVCVKLIESMPDRVAMVLKEKGGYTNY